MFRTGAFCCWYLHLYISGFSLTFVRVWAQSRDKSGSVKSHTRPRFCGWSGTLRQHRSAVVLLPRLGLPESHRLDSAVSWEAGRCPEGVCRGAGRKRFASSFFLPLSPAVFLVGQAALFLAAAGLGRIGQGEEVWGASTHAICLPPCWHLPASGHLQKSRLESIVGC